MHIDVPQRAAIVFGLVVSLIALAATANAKIDPAASIAGIEIGMTPSEVIAAKGRPDRRGVIETNPFDVLRLRYGKTRAEFAGTGPGADVIRVSTTSPAQRTPKGAGVGWTEERLLREMPLVRCRNRGAGLFCFRGKIRTNRQLTFFHISNRTGRVSSVDVSLIIPD
jgi:hypothetical protein